LTPLHFAVRNGCVEVAQLLIENGASLSQPSSQGITPLDWFSEYLDPDQRKLRCCVLPLVTRKPMLFRKKKLQ
jgi:ankyrin repeat protein